MGLVAGRLRLSFLGLLSLSVVSVDWSRLLSVLLVRVVLASEHNERQLDGEQFLSGLLDFSDFMQTELLVADLVLRLSGL